MKSEKSGGGENAGLTAASNTLSAAHGNLYVGANNDPLEHEADAMADRVMRMPESNFIQRKCAHCEQEEKLQRKTVVSFIQKKEAANNNAVASNAVSSQIQSSKGNGSRIPETTKSFMESRFGADFSNVNIHSGSYASQLSNQLNAQAFTVGNDIYFNEGKYQPESSDGKRLLAHELTHTVQQGNMVSGKIQKKEMPFNPAVIAVQLRDAMEGWGTDEASIYAALSGRTPAQVDVIAVQYKKLTGRDLQADLIDELNDSELQKLALYGQVLSDTPENKAMSVAVQLRDAMEGWGTDENAIYVALQSRSEHELNLIRKAYFKLTKRQLMVDLRDELNDNEYKKATGIMGINKIIWVNIGFDSSARADTKTTKKLNNSIAAEQAAINNCCSIKQKACNIEVKTHYDMNSANKPAPADKDYDNDDAADKKLQDTSMSNITAPNGGIKILVTESTLSQTWQGKRIFPRANTGSAGVLWNPNLAADDTIAHESGHAAGYKGDIESNAHSSDPHNLMSPGSKRLTGATPDDNWCDQMTKTAV